jgi:hypothetical protein
MSINFRRIMLGAINAVMIFSLAARAQQVPAPDSNPATAGTAAQDAQQNAAEPVRQQFRRIAALAQYLNLSEEQKRQFVQIQRETTQSVRAARRDDTLSEDKMQKKLKEIHADQRRQLLGLLTPEQQEALKKWWEEQKQKQQNKGTSATGQAASQDQAVSQEKDKSDASDDDLFAGMVQDPEPPARPPQTQNQNKPAPK